MSLFSKKKKEKEVSIQSAENQNQPKDYWICPKCQTNNSLASRSCKDCGYYR
ncbi:MAG: hypothetical protein PUC65_07210 [Clostridiales bacterium]|nr:hypothetical protein [Clostridiales bacterium]